MKEKKMHCYEKGIGGSGFLKIGGHGFFGGVGGGSFGGVGGSFGGFGGSCFSLSFQLFIVGTVADAFFFFLTHHKSYSIYIFLSYSIYIFLFFF